MVRALCTHTHSLNTVLVGGVFSGIKKYYWLIMLKLNCKKK